MFKTIVKWGGGVILKMDTVKGGVAVFYDILGGGVMFFLDNRCEETTGPLPPVKNDRSLDIQEVNIKISVLNMTYVKSGS